MDGFTVKCLGVVVLVDLCGMVRFDRLSTQEMRHNGTKLPLFLLSLLMLLFCCSVLFDAINNFIEGEVLWD